MQVGWHITGLDSKKKVVFMSKPESQIIKLATGHSAGWKHPFFNREFSASLSGCSWKAPGKDGEP